MAALLVAPPPGVDFQNEGTLTGWDYHYPQKNGVIRDVTNVKYKGSTAIEAKQTYIGETGGYRYAGQCAGLQPGGEGPCGRPVTAERALGRRVLPLDVLARHADRGVAGRVGDVRA